MFNNSHKLSECISEQNLKGKLKVLRGDQLTKSHLSEPNELVFVRSSTRYDQEMSKDLVDRSNP